MLESAAKVGFDTLSKDKEALGHLVDGVMRGRHYDEWDGILKDWLAAFLTQAFGVRDGNLSLADLSVKDCLTEMEFWFEANDVRATSMDVIFKEAALPNENRPALNPSTLNGVLKGFIDLVFRHDNKYYVADYKSNWLGKDEKAYTETAIRHALLEKRYDAQYVLYLLALHRYLKSRLGDDYDYERDIGGAVYFFLRGVGGPVGGVHFEKPSKDSIEKLDLLFRGSVSQEVQHAGK